MKVNHGNSSFNCVQLLIIFYLNLSYKDHDKTPDRRY